LPKVVAAALLATALERAALRLLASVRQSLVAALAVLAAVSRGVAPAALVLLVVAWVSAALALIRRMPLLRVVVVVAV